MKIPSFLYGNQKDVQSRCRKKVTALQKGTSWVGLADAWVDTREAPGLLVLKGPSPFLAHGEHFHVYALVRELARWRPGRPPPERDVWLPSALESEWGVLGLLSQDGMLLLFRGEVWHVPFLEAAARFWPGFEAEGPRYTLGLGEGEPLSDLATNPSRVLAPRGVPLEELQEPMTAQRLARFVEPD